MSPIFSSQTLGLQWKSGSLLWSLINLTAQEILCLSLAKGMMRTILLLLSCTSSTILTAWNPSMPYKNQSTSSYDSTYPSCNLSVIFANHSESLSIFVCSGCQICCHLLPTFNPRSYRTHNQTRLGQDELQLKNFHLYKACLQMVFNAAQILQQM